MAHLYSYICLAGGSSNRSQLTVNKVCAELNAKSTKNRVKLYRLHFHIVFFKMRPSDLSRRSELYDLLFASVMFPASWVIFLLGHRKWHLPLCNSNWPFDLFFFLWAWRDNNRSCSLASCWFPALFIVLFTTSLLHHCYKHAEVNAPHLWREDCSK